MKQIMKKYLRSSKKNLKFNYCKNFIIEKNAVRKLGIEFYPDYYEQF